MDDDWLGTDKNEPRTFRAMATFQQIASRFDRLRSLSGIELHEMGRLIKN